MSCVSCKRQVGMCVRALQSQSCPRRMQPQHQATPACALADASVRCCKAGEQWCAFAYSMPPAVATGSDAAAALPAVDESAAQHAGLDKQVAPPAALSPAQPTSEGRQHPRRSIDVEPAQV